MSEVAASCVAFGLWGPGKNVRRAADRERWWPVLALVPAGLVTRLFRPKAPNLLPLPSAGNEPKLYLI
jgi:hypothetical protein